MKDHHDSLLSKEDDEKHPLQENDGAPRNSKKRQRQRKRNANKRSFGAQTSHNNGRTYGGGGGGGGIIVCQQQTDHYTTASKFRFLSIAVLALTGSYFIWARYSQLEGMYLQFMGANKGGGGGGGGNNQTIASSIITPTTAATATDEDINSRTITTVLGTEIKLKPGWRAPGDLRFDWMTMPVKSQLANKFKNQQNNCDLPMLTYRNRNNAGMGSDLHVYGMALCNAHRRNSRMFTPMPWMYWDDDNCAAAVTDGTIPKSESCMSCYFPTLELQCPGDEVVASQLWNETLVQREKGNDHYKRIYWETHDDMSCSSILHRPGYAGLFNIMDVRAAITEYVFSTISKVLMDEAKRQHALVFRHHGAPPPHQMITCHVRWGDKGREMALVPIRTYIESVHEMAAQNDLLPNETHVFLASEDPRAVDAFRHAAHPEWTIYIDQFYVEMLPHRNNQTQEVAGTAREGFGRTGLLALGSMLVTMESNFYILSTGSNWSRVMNELRKNVLRPRCHLEGQSRTVGQAQVDCTGLIDVQPAGSQYETGVAARMSQHQLILQKLQMIRNQNQAGYRTHMHGAINYGAGVKPESIKVKEEHAKTHRYPRLQKRNRGNGRRRRRLFQQLFGQDEGAFFDNPYYIYENSVDMALDMNGGVGNMSLFSTSEYDGSNDGNITNNRRRLQRRRIQRVQIPYVRS